MPEPKIPVNDMRFEVGIEADRILDSQDVMVKCGLRDEPDPVEVERARVFRAAETLLAWIDANQKRVRAVLTVKPGLIDDTHRAKPWKKEQESNDESTTEEKTGTEKAGAS